MSAIEASTEGMKLIKLCPGLHSDPQHLKHQGLLNALATHASKDNFSVMSVMPMENQSRQAAQGTWGIAH